MDVRIRIAEEADVPAITEIYNQAVAMRTATAHLLPVSLENRRRWLRDHEPDMSPVFVADAGGGVVGWCSLSPYRPGRQALRHTAEVSYYVHEDVRRQGVGRRLVTHAVAACPHLEIRTLIAILLDVNVASAGLLDALGFRRWGHLPGVAEIDEATCGHLYYGYRVAEKPHS